MANVLTLEIMKKITGNNSFNPDYINALNTYMPQYEINTLPRIQFFIAIACGESGGFKALSEGMTYSSVDRIKQVFDKKGTRFKNEDINIYVKSPGRLANRVYGGTCHNNQLPFTSSETECLLSDGYKYRGGGIFQLTFKSNYVAFAKDMGIADVADLVTPGKLYCVHEINGAVRSACHYAKNRGILTEADKNTPQSFIAACRKVGNCADGNNYAKKREYWAKCKAYIGGNGSVDFNDTTNNENTRLTYLTAIEPNVFLAAKQKLPH